MNQAAPPAATSELPKWRRRLAWMGTAATTLLITIVVLRCVVAMTNEPDWQAELQAAVRGGPAQAMDVSLGPLGVAVLDWLAVGVLGLVLIHAAVQVAPVNWWLIGLWWIGTVFVGFHAARDSDALRVGGSWVAAMALGIAAFHLARELRFRRVMIAAMIALAVPLAVDGLAQVSFIHRQTVHNYEQNREQVLAEQGWEPGSTEQLKYERRLYQNEASGAFGLANVYATVAGALGVLGIGVGVSLIRRRRVGNKSTSWIPIAASLATGVLSIIALLLSGSKGGIGSVVIAGVLAGGAWLVAVRWLKTRWRAVPWMVAMALAVIAPWVAVAGRAAMGLPESAAGERSLLFRAMYWQAAGRMIADQPAIGVGPGGFKSAYLVAKSPYSPEEVASPHNVIVEYLATLGIGGWCWLAVLLLMLWAAAEAAAQQMRRNASVADDDRPSNEVRPAYAWSAAIVVGALAFGARFQLGLAGVDSALWLAPAVLVVIAYFAARWQVKGAQYAGWLLLVLALVGVTVANPYVGFEMMGALGFIAVMGILASGRRLDLSMASLGLFTASAAAIAHSQIEMSLTNPMSAPAIFVLLGVAGGSAAVHRPNWLSTHRLRGITIFIVLITVLAWGQLMIRLVVSQLGVSNAGRAVRRDDVRDAYMVLAIRGDGNDASLCALTAKLGYAPVLQSDNDIVKVPGNLEQLMQRHLVEPRQYLSRRALLWRTEANLAWQAWRDTGEPKWRERAMDAIVGWLAHDPYGVESHLRAADIAWQAGRIDEARQWYARALELSEKAYLDELSQLTAEGRARAQLRLRSPAP